MFRTDSSLIRAPESIGTSRARESLGADQRARHHLACVVSQPPGIRQELSHHRPRQSGGRLERCTAGNLFDLLDGLRCDCGAKRSRRSRRACVRNVHGRHDRARARPSISQARALVDSGMHRRGRVPCRAAGARSARGADAPRHDGRRIECGVCPVSLRCWHSPRAHRRGHGHPLAMVSERARIHRPAARDFQLGGLQPAFANQRPDAHHSRGSRHPHPRRECPHHRESYCRCEARFDPSRRPRILDRSARGDTSGGSGIPCRASRWSATRQPLSQFLSAARSANSARHRRAHFRGAACRGPGYGRRPSRPA